MWQRKWVMGNWKMNGRNALVHDLLTTLLPTLATIPNTVQVGLALPAVYMSLARQMVAASGNPLWLGAEDVSRFAADGAFTGETSAAMFADAGACFALIGHSERRQYFAEDNAVLREKLSHSIAAGLLPVLCVGETLAEREAGQAQNVVAAQLSVLADLPLTGIAVAYEPVWAIGTGKVACATQIAEIHSFIYREILSLCGENVKIRTLYGGSVNAGNAAEILAVPHVDGALIGGAALQAGSFAAIIDAAVQYA